VSVTPSPLTNRSSEECSPGSVELVHDPNARTAPMLMPVTKLAGLMVHSMERCTVTP
jgi:hypothetical protein